MDSQPTALLIDGLTMQPHRLHYTISFSVQLYLYTWFVMVLTHLIIKVRYFYNDKY